MTRNNPYISRRNALQTVAGAALASVAGCLNNGESSGTPGDGTTSPDSQGPLKRVAVEGPALVVELSVEADVDQVNLIQPNGELFGTRDVAAGARQVSFEIGTAYEPGEYRVVALKSEETVVETSLSIQPNLSIVEMGIGRNQPEKMWDSSSDKVTKEAFVTVENQGSGPAAIYADNDDVSGIYDPETDTEVDAVVVEPGEKLTLYSYRSPFAFIRGEGTSCKSEEQVGEFEVVLETRVGANTVSKTYSIQYSASEEFDNCDTTISEA
jgi:hypothetical protein